MILRFFFFLGLMSMIACAESGSNTKFQRSTPKELKVSKTTNTNVNTILDQLTVNYEGDYLVFADSLADAIAEKYPNKVDAAEKLSDEMKEVKASISANGNLEITMKSEDKETTGPWIKITGTPENGSLRITESPEKKEETNTNSKAKKNKKAFKSTLKTMGSCIDEECTLIVAFVIEASKDVVVPIVLFDDEKVEVATNKKIDVLKATFDDIEKKLNEDLQPALSLTKEYKYHVLMRPMSNEIDRAKLEIEGEGKSLESELEGLSLGNQGLTELQLNSGN